MTIASTKTSYMVETLVEIAAASLRGSGRNVHSLQLHFANTTKKYFIQVY